MKKIKKLTIGIIGGTGQMGQFFKKFFEDNNFEVLVGSRKTKGSVEECVKKSDIVIISVPIDKTVEVIKKVGPLVRQGSLFMDFTSIKVQPVDAMLKYSGKDVDVIGAHPVFGPSVKNICNQTIVLTPARGEKWLEWIKVLFEKNKAKVKISTPDKHDRMMAVIQCMAHFSNVAIASAIKKMGVDIRESLEYTSPVYKLRMDMVGRILNQDPLLYADIEIMNKYSLDAINEYIKCARELKKIIEQKDINMFVDYFNEAANFFGDFKKEALEESNYLIEQMVKRKECRSNK